MATPSNEQKAHAMTLWRDGYDQVVSRGDERKEHETYATALICATGLLHIYLTFDELVASYFANAIDDACQAACNRTGKVLNAGLVEDAAYWIRMKQLQRRGFEAHE